MQPVYFLVWPKTYTHYMLNFIFFYEHKTIL